VDRGIQRHVRTGELWFVGRRGGRVIWQRLQTQDLSAARVTVAMIEAQPNGNVEISLVVDGEKHPIADNVAGIPDKPLPRVRRVLVAEDGPAVQPSVASTPVIHGRAKNQTVPSLDELLNRWRRGKAGLKPGTERKLDNHLKMLRRYVDTKNVVTDYKAQDIREFIAKAREDKDGKGRRRLKGQTINESILRPLSDAFDLALEEGFVSRNPMASVKKEKTEPINGQSYRLTDAKRRLKKK
jgi:hypothetical protein